VRNIFLTTMLLISVVGCNGGGGGGGSSSTTTPVSHYGIWEHCENYDGNSDGTNDSSLKRVLTIGDDEMTLLRTNHNTTGCTQGSEGYRFVNRFSYTRSADQYSVTLMSETYVALSDADVAIDNGDSWCGITNWVKNQVRNIIGLTCGGEVANIGDTDSLSLTKSGSTLSTGVISYSLTADVDLSPAGQVFPNGNYIYSDGVNYALYATFSGGSYSLYRYDLVSLTYSRENGAYTSSNNVVTFSVSSSQPVGCYTGTFSRRFSYGSGGIVVEFTEDDFTLIAPKVNDSEALFRSSYIGGSYSLGCI
jgi:hypothetical protein